MESVEPEDVEASGVEAVEEEALQDVAAEVPLLRSLVSIYHLVDYEITFVYEACWHFQLELSNLRSFLYESKISQ